MAIIGALPITLANATTADATQVMQDFSFIVSQVNTNAADIATTPQLNTTNLFTQACTFSLPVIAPPATARSHLVPASQVQDGRLNYLTGVAGTNAITGNAGISPLAYAVGQRFTFIPAVTNTAAATLNINAVGAQPFQLSGQPLTGGELRAGKPVSVVWTGGAFALVEGAWGGGRPVGSMVTLAGAFVPPDVLLCYGQAVATTGAGADLFAQIGYTYGGAGANFSLPDVRGMVVIGRDNMGGATRGLITFAGCSITGTTLGAAGGNQLAQAHAHGFTGGTSSVSGVHNHTTGVTQNPVVGGVAQQSLSAQVTNAAFVQNFTSTTDPGHTHTMGGTVNSNLSGGSQNVQPSIVMNVGIVY